MLGVKVNHIKIVSKLKGGLGNQLFQFAYGYARALQLGIALELELSYFDHDARHGGYTLGLFKLNNKVKLTRIGFLLNLFLKFDERITGKIGFLWRSIDERYGPNDHYVELGNTIYLNGFWQNPRLINEYSEQIKKAIKLKVHENSIQFLQIKDDISRGQSVGVHFRRGDYISDKGAASVHGVIGKSYYGKAVSEISSVVTEPKFFIFSDDIDLAKKELSFIENGVFVSTIFDSDATDMYLMSLCKHNIIANSTYSWWSAWLNENDGKIIVAPKRWYANDEMNQQCYIIPPEWVTV